MNYTELKAALTSWLENEGTSFASNRDLFIQLGERRLHMALELPSAQKSATTTLVIGEEYLQLPSDVISILDLALVQSGVHTHLRKKEEGFIREAYPTVATTGTPLFYSVFDHNTALLGPTPDATDTVEITYHGVPTSIVSAATTWLGTNCERALLYAALLEGYVFMKGDPDMIKKYEDSFREEVTKMSALVARKAHDSDMFESTFAGGQ